MQCVRLRRTALRANPRMNTSTQPPDGGVPTEQDRSEGMPSPGEAPNERGRSPLVTLGLFQSDSL